MVRTVNLVINRITSFFPKKLEFTLTFNFCISKKIAMDSKPQERGVQLQKTFSRHFLSLSWQRQKAGKGRSQPALPHLDYHCRYKTLQSPYSFLATETKVPRFSKQKGWLTSEHRMPCQTKHCSEKWLNKSAVDTALRHTFFATQFFWICYCYNLGDVYICKHNYISYLFQIYKTKIFMQSVQLVTKKTF